MSGTALRLDRTQILAFRRRVQALDQRLPAGSASLRQAAWAGIQDSMPRAALLSIHARVEGTRPDALADPALVQVWGPRYSVYVIAAQDVAPFTLGRLPDDARGRQRAEDTASRLRAFLEGRELTHDEVGQAWGVHPNAVRYGAPTGTILIRWNGARAPTVRSVAPPPIDAAEARRELARRYLHCFGPTTGDAFAEWAGIGRAGGVAAFAALAAELITVDTPIGSAWILAEDEPGLRAAPTNPAPARLLPSGDTYFLLQGADRELLIPQPHLRSLLWTSRVWPGAVLVAGEIVGTWRRANATVSIEPWRRLSAEERTAVEAEAAALPLPGLDRPIVVRWTDAVSVS